MMAAVQNSNEEIDTIEIENCVLRNLKRSLSSIATLCGSEVVSTIRNQIPLQIDTILDGTLNMDTNGINNILNDLVSEFVQAFTNYIEHEFHIDSGTLIGFYGDSQKITGNNSIMKLNGIHLEDHIQNKSLTDTEQSQSNTNEQINISQDESNMANPVSSSLSSHTNQTINQSQGKKPFYRRLSFKGLRKSRLFHRQFSDELNLNCSMTEGSSTKSKHNSKFKVAKIVVECSKDGVVQYISGESIENSDGSQHWEKCRLVLVKTAGGYMLEFYSPPKSLKPKSGVFCFLITEVRETTTLEMPDRENTFVLKAEHNIEYVIQAPDAKEMNSWLSLIKYSMRSQTISLERQRGSSSSTTIHDETVVNPITTRDSEQNGHPESSSASSVFHSGANGYAAPIPLPPQLPPRILGAQQQSETVNPIRSTSANSLEGGPSSEPPIRSIPGTSILTVNADGRDPYSALQDYPWFHGTLSRSEAARLVLQDGLDGHGTFLVRQSETRTGEFVLTFNFQGKAKHLRMTLSSEGQCRVQHLWFQSVFDMLEHFRLQPIPLESGGGTSDVTLTEFVVSLPSLHGVGNMSDRSRSVPPEFQTVLTHNGSVRTRSESMERLHREQTSGGMSRAVENTYSFV